MIGKNIKKNRLELGLTQDKMAQELNQQYPNTFNFNKGRISKWENGHDEPMLSTVKILADYFDLSIDELVYGSPDQEENQDEITTQIDSEYVYEDLYGVLSAGTGQMIYDNPIESVLIPQNIVPKSDYDIMLKIVGDSMEPAFRDGEYVFIKKTHDIRSGQFVAVLIDGEAYLKKFHFEDGIIRLVSLNDKYDDIIVGYEQMFNVVGVVVL